MHRSHPPFAVGFQRESAVETAAAILNEEPPDIAGAMKGVPPRLEAIVARCLEKAPEDRFQSARDLAHDLGTILQDTRPAKHGSAPATGKRWRMIVFASAAVAVLTVVAVLVFKVAAPVREEIARAKYFPEKETAKIGEIRAKIDRQLSELHSLTA